MAFVAIVATLSIGGWSVACNSPSKSTPQKLRVAPPEPAPLLLDLQEIRARGKLVALTENTSTSYFIFKGQAMGYEYELLDEYCEYMDLELEILLIDDFDIIFEMLDDGTCDIIACNLTVTRDRKRYAAFSQPYLQTRQVLVQRLPEGHEEMRNRRLREHLVTNPIDLIGKEVHVRNNSSFKTRLLHLSEEIGGAINIVEAPVETEVEELIKMVSTGEIDYTIADENVAQINQHYYDNLDISMAVSLPQQIAWATRKNSTELQASIDKWMQDEQRTIRYMHSKYFLATTQQKRRVNSEYSSLSGGKISMYDEFLKEECKKIGWDWRLVAAVIYQESKFKPQAKSWMGAFGLMQLMPNTALRYGLDETATPEQNMRAGIDKLGRLDRHWAKRISNDHERLKFVLASYNAGLGHVQDACRLAEKNGKNPFLWDDHVAEAILLKSMRQHYNDPVVIYGYCRGREPYNYVTEILNRYDQYAKTIIQ